jgi:Rad3-related DNA helicase
MARPAVDRAVEGEPSHGAAGNELFLGGVDIVGDALSLLVITKLPFPVPSDPVFAARSEQFDDPFGHYAVPQAVLRFKQGFGRLIRSNSDRGVCAVLDRRIVSRRYGDSFINSLPSCELRVGSLQTIATEVDSYLNMSPLVNET